MKTLTVLGIIMVFALVISAVYVAHDSPFSEELKESIDYTPSQNLAISEGRFEEARQSISKMNG